MRVLPLGVGDAFSRRFYSSCLFVEHEGFGLLVDCPHPVRKMMAEGGARAGWPVDLPDVHALIVTHLHGDHASGVEGLLWFDRFVCQRRTQVVCHPAVWADLWDRHLAGGMHQLLTAHGPVALTADDLMVHVPVQEEQVVTLGPFRLRCRRTVHHIPTFAWRLEGGGRSLGISSDTSFDPSLLAWLGEADAVIHEANEGVHTPAHELAKLPEALRSRIWLTHLGDHMPRTGWGMGVLEEGRALELTDQGLEPVQSSGFPESPGAGGMGKGGWEAPGLRGN